MTSGRAIASVGQSVVSVVAMPAKPVREGLFAASSEDGTVWLLGSECTKCARTAFPASELCPYCGSDRTQVSRLPSDGVVELCTLVRKSPPGYRGPTPYGLAVIRLTSDLLIVAPVETHEVLACGTRVRCGVREVGEDEEGNLLLAPCFRVLEVQPEASLMRVVGS